MLTKAPSLPADEVFMDLEDSVAPLAKEEARGNVIDALKNNDWGDKTVVVRINSIDTQWAADDLKTIVEDAGAYLDCVMIPKVQHAHEVHFVDHLLRMIETNTGLEKRIGIEAQIETATGLKNVYDIAHASDRLETLIFGPADMSASLGLPTVTAGLPMPGYPGDHWHWVLEKILVAARDAGLQAIDGPYLLIKDLDGFREMAMRSRALGYDGKWALHPGQIDVLNEVFAPTQEEYDKAEAILEAFRDFVESEVFPVAEELEHRDEYPEKIVEQLKEMGLFGLTVPEEFGGAGMDLLTYALVVTELSRGWMSL